ncbi:MAG: biotin--[acetyl-CoA-carboxylase] ligase [Gammaproteobacteria bacterium]|nr:biotin--[acetyl-CoA-carboxylase] ligase [Gammaproteobacteria bacterium]MBQ0774399.1 biotin--[acetyl-CoA-carboxylase] ligase [Gammaproteobacteria bacterium]
MAIESSYPLILMLMDGAFHSGESLGEQLGVSRAAVWKRIKGLSKYAIDVESVKGKGYRIPGGLSLLSREEVLRHAGANEGALTLDIKTETGSTNVDALYAARVRLDQPYAVLAEYQSSGKGRRGRVWHSPFASSIYLSLAMQFSDGAARLEGLSLAVGVAVAELLRREGIQGVSLKWPNDVLVNGAKLGGVLIELTGDFDADCRAVIGVGLNGALPSSLSVDQPVIDLYELLGVRVDRNRWAGLLLKELISMLDLFSRQGFAPFRSRWQSVDGLKGENVTVYQGDVATSGVALGVTDRGALLVETACNQIVEFHGGEVTVRKVV